MSIGGGSGELLGHRFVIFWFKRPTLCPLVGLLQRADLLLPLGLCRNVDMPVNILNATTSALLANAILK
jgi:hypothetical protein